MTENLNKIWKNAVPWGTYFRQLSKDLELGIAALEPMNDLISGSAPQTAFDETLLSVNRSLRSMNLKISARNSAQQTLHEHLVTGDLEAIGREHISGGSFELALVPSSFWLGVDQVTEADDIHDGYRRFDWLRVIAAQASASTSTESEIPSAAGESKSLETQTRATAGRPSQRDMIFAAIEHQLSQNPNWWVAVAKAERRRSYYARIKQEYRIDPQRADGFSEKTIEKYETLFRKQTKR
ncbi:MAG: hypothetical protein RLO80_12310 [Hyphomonas sp.]